MKYKLSILLMCILLVAGFSGFAFADEKFELKMYVGEVIDLDSFLIENQMLTAEEDMSWTSGNESVVQVNSSGRVEALESGKATIYAKDKNNSSRVATIKIEVVSMVDDFRLVKDSITIRIGEVVNLEYEITPVDGQDSVYNEEIEWTSSNLHIAEVDENGQVVGVKEGTTTIHAKTVDGNRKDDVTVVVSGLKEDILIDDGAKEVDIYVGGSHDFKATSDGIDVTLGVEWSSVIEDTLTIDDNGVAEGLEEGTTQVKAATWDKKKFDTIMVNVISMVKGITLSEKSVRLEHIDDTIDLDYTLIPAFEGLMPYEDDVKWTSSNSNIASVDGNGVVTAKDKGIARITATTVDGELEAYCTVTTLEDADEREVIVQKISLDHPVETLFVGQKYELPIVIEPANATETDLVFGTKIGSSSQVSKEEDDDDVMHYYF
ncbi:MAG: Ig-like domain-containing protein, partial [Clostridia bacterium]|nr:Ig-like domain-containing protein [Clostridia bacterium]